jgi:16S rRNA (guanine966-N2)-methyltransferase
VVAVERDPNHYNFIRKTCDELGLDLVTVIRGDALRYLKNPSQSFDIIFADPPFDHPLLATLPDLVFDTEVLAREGRFILEHPSSHTFTAHDHFLQHRKYGGVNFTFFG